MKTWNQEKYIKAWNFASVAHQGQLVPGTENPYINHIGLVSMEAMSVITSTQKINNPDLLIQCTLLHDTIEDTDCTYEDLQKEFGSEVAEGVSALTKNSELPSKDEKMRDSLARIKQQSKEIWMVKLCDRITNLQPPPEHWHQNKIEAYRDEAVLILENLGESNQYLANRLQNKIDGYKHYLGKFEVFVGDNFHFMDESEIYRQGVYETYEEAVEVCKSIINDFFLNCDEDKTAEDLYGGYVQYGESPLIKPNPKNNSFSAPDYARQRCKEICG
jgi:hypothetical protein|tara:strand:- start:978 stop:1799 length:822 start_codon:yes stop_codon:yes gene_type:complete